MRILRKCIFATVQIAKMKENRVLVLPEGSKAEWLTKNATDTQIVNMLDNIKKNTPADLYKLDKYWQMQSQLKKEAQKLGDKEIALLSKEFEKEWINVYESISLPSGATFNTISTSGARVMINDVWLADGKTFSDRVWKNVNHLVETLNDNMINCVVTGKKTTQLRDLLMHRFKVSRSQANALVRTELAHIETEAAKQRYEDCAVPQSEIKGRCKQR